MGEIELIEVAEQRGQRREGTGPTGSCLSLLPKKTWLLIVAVIALQHR